MEDEIPPAIVWALVRIGSWTNATWSQHVRHEFGDMVAVRAEEWLVKHAGPDMESRVAALCSE